MRHAVAAVAVAGCWTSPPAQPLSGAEPAARCVLQGREIETSAVRVVYGDDVFASIDGPFRRLTVELEGSRGRVHLATAELELAGDADLATLALRTRRSELFAGWIEIQQARVTNVDGATAALALALPAIVEPQRARARLDCNDLTFARPFDPFEGDEISLPEGRYSLRAAPGGAIVATVTVPAARAPDAPWSVYELDRRGGATRIRIDSENPVVGWIDGHAAIPSEPDRYGTLMGTLSTARYQCSGPTEIFLRRGAQLVSVGRFAPNATIEIGETHAKLAVHEVLLGGVVNPVVTAVALAGCRKIK